MPMLPFILCELKPVTLTPSDLRWDLVNISVGVLLLVIGLTVSTLFFFRPRWRDRSLIYFGVFTMLYAIRLLGTRMLVESVIDVSRVFWLYFNFYISAVIVIPFGLYLYELVEPEVKRILPVDRWHASDLRRRRNRCGNLRRRSGHSQQDQQHRHHRHSGPVSDLDRRPSRKASFKP